MKRHLQKVKAYTAEKNEVFIGIAVVAILLIAVAIIVFAINNSGPKIVYQPTKACSLLPPAKAQDLLGDKVISTDVNEPVITGNVATSKCSYTDENPDQGEMMVAAVAVRTGINDEGVVQNKTDFKAKKPKQGAQDVDNIGDSAYFDQTLGQLNILKGHDWLILSYGVGSAPAANTVDDAVKLAHKIL